MRNALRLTGICAMMLIIVGGAFAQEGIGLYDVGGKIAYVDPENVDATIGFGIFANLGQVMEGVQLEANVDLWSKSFKQSVVGASGESSFRDLSVGATGKYMIETANDKMRPFVGGALGFHFLNATVKSEYTSPFTGQTTSSETSSSDTKIGVGVVAGLWYTLSETLDGLAEFRYNIVSDFNTLNLMVGVSYKRP